MRTKEVIKRDSHIRQVEKFAVYVDSINKIIGIYSTVEDSLKAEKSKELKSLIKKYKFKIQMVIK